MKDTNIYIFFFICILCLVYVSCTPQPFHETIDTCLISNNSFDHICIQSGSFIDDLLLPILEKYINIFDTKYSIFCRSTIATTKKFEF